MTLLSPSRPTISRPSITVYSISSSITQSFELLIYRVKKPSSYQALYNTMSLPSLSILKSYFKQIFLSAKSPCRITFFSFPGWILAPLIAFINTISVMQGPTDIEQPVPSCGKIILTFSNCSKNKSSLYVASGSLFWIITQRYPSGQLSCVYLVINGAPLFSNVITLRSAVVEFNLAMKVSLKKASLVWFRDSSENIVLPGP